MGAERQRLGAPIRQPEQRADADPAEAAGVSALRTVEPPVEVFLRAGGVQFLIDRAVVGFLIDHEPLRTVGDDFRVVGVLHRPDLDGQRGDERLERVQALLEIAVGDEFRVLAGHQQQVAEAAGVQMARLGHHLADAQRGAQDARVAGKSAVGTIVDALVGKIQRGKKPHRAAKMAAGRLLAEAREWFQRAAGCFGQHALEAPHQRRGALEQVRKHIGESHGGRNMPCRGPHVKGGLPESWLRRPGAGRGGGDSPPRTSPPNNGGGPRQPRAAPATAGTCPWLAESRVSPRARVIISLSLYNRFPTYQPQAGAAWQAAYTRFNGLLARAGK